MPNGTNANGTYTMAPAAGLGPVLLTGKGRKTGNDGSTPVTIVMQVWVNSAKVDPTKTNQDIRLINNGPEFRPFVLPFWNRIAHLPS